MSVYTHISEISEILLFSIGSVCIQKIFIPVKEGISIIQYELNLIFWIDNTFMGLNSKVINRYVMITLPLLFSRLSVFLLWRHHMLLVACVSCLLENFMHTQANFFFSFEWKEKPLNSNQKESYYWPESLSHFYFQQQLSARPILSKWRINWVEQGSRVIIHCHSPLGSQVSLPLIVLSSDLDLDFMDWPLTCPFETSSWFQRVLVYLTAFFCCLSILW